MIIREAKEEELSFIRMQRVKAYREHERSVNEEHWQGLKQAISSEIDADEKVEVIVAEIDGQIVGSVVLFPPKMDVYEGLVTELDNPEIRMLAVDPDVRGRGVAKALIQKCIEKAKNAGHQAIGLHTGDFMHQAIALYQRLGFERQPSADFEPANDGVIVKAFRLTL
ncbi:GNAT family N-acetyltransferase [Aquibacillus salsiterrae]|uniref:GNAT family N-acetyltransferase n=1 Tax=Aquibacillus salsiterrae TaxID=2950439 RepID=A0A9X3WD32_9BACI|nr:GNAT family N-acetyltransferase [Aquibacillus salsiterrae]MDC3417372.1 GNAT family N-acetyltransferase [Aquibacillus salsiterrae]